MRKLQETCVIKDLKTPDVYLGGTYIGNPRDKWCITAREYIKEAKKQIEERLNIKLREEKTPIKMNDHPEEDDSPVFDNDMHRLHGSPKGKGQSKRQRTVRNSV
jgi:hypothetical protein